VLLFQKSFQIVRRSKNAAGFTVRGELDMVDFQVIEAAPEGKGAV